MNTPAITRDDCFGLVHPSLDAHTLGINALMQVLQDCGCRVSLGGPETCAAVEQPDALDSAPRIEQWIRANRITVFGFSYRLDPDTGVACFSRVLALLKDRRLLAGQGGPLRALYFAGLPAACHTVARRHPEVNAVFCGDETPAETLRLLGVDSSWLPRDTVAGMAYDEDRLAFGRELVARGDYQGVKPVRDRGYSSYGTAADTLVARLAHGYANGALPLVRAHVGPYLPGREEAVRLFSQWTRTLADAGLLDVLSIGTSQLTQSHFGEVWGPRPNGGGVPLNSAAEFAAVWHAARPMLVRTYAGTRDIPALARLYEDTIHCAWHALSLWWFCQLDGRGPYTLRENLQQHFETLDYIAAIGSPFEPNVPHHFAFRGADDVTGVVAGVLAARVAKAAGIQHMVLQIMLNTPKYTWGVQDLAKARVLLQLVRELEDERFHVILQPRGGLDYFSPDLDKAKAQLAAVTALMDDIEPSRPTSPPLIHVVSYSEASHLADPATINESIRITRHSLDCYRRLRAKGDIDDMTSHPEVLARCRELMADVRRVLQAIETHVADPYSAAGLYATFARGFLPLPYLWACRDEFPCAVRWQTRVVRGSVKLVDATGEPLTVASRLHLITQTTPQ